MVASARRTVRAGRRQKIGVESSLRFATLEEIDVLVTDDAISDADRRALDRTGVEVVVA